MPRDCSPTKRRHTIADPQEIITDRDERAARESANGVRQFDAVRGLIDVALDPDRQPFLLRPSMIMGLQRIATDGIRHDAGVYRVTPATIVGSDHKPPDAWRVPLEVEKFCDYVNRNFDDETALHLAAYALWRLNWIHPFGDGNGRTSRSVSYLLLCARLESQLPGSPAVPQIIAADKNPYYAALEATDKTVGEDTDRFDLSPTEAYLSEVLAAQLVGVVKDAGGEIGDG